MQGLSITRHCHHSNSSELGRTRGLANCKADLEDLVSRWPKRLIPKVGARTEIEHIGIERNPHFARLLRHTAGDMLSPTLKPGPTRLFDLSVGRDSFAAHTTVREPREDLSVISSPAQA